MTRTQSAFGVEFDSLADLISFGVAPAAIAYRWALTEAGVEVRMSKAGVELAPRPGFDAAKLEELQ
jgi:phosphatidylserine synthase